MLSHNELGLAFDCLVDLGDSSVLGRSFWEHLDLAAREMGLYGRVLHTPNLASVDLLLRHLAATAAGATGR